jgi:hypothetical protein
MTYQEWCDAVELGLRANKRGVRLQQIDPDALEHGFDDGTSPIVFARLDPLPLISKPAPKTAAAASTKPKPSRFLPYGTAAVFGLIIVWGITSFVRNDLAERQLKNQSYPIEYPVKVPGGVFTPPFADTARDFALNYVRTALLKPSSGQFQDDITLVEKQLGMYTIRGQVEAVNEFGTRVAADFAIEVGGGSRLISGQRQDRPERLKVGEFFRGTSGQSSVWRDPTNVTSDVDHAVASDGVFTQSKAAAKRFNPMRQLRLGQNLYSDPGPVQ